jgi:hypothetical protein
LPPRQELGWHNLPNLTKRGQKRTNNSVLRITAIIMDEHLVFARFGGLSPYLTVTLSPHHISNE